MKARDEGGLTPNEEQFARNRAKGHSQAESYRLAWPGTRLKPQPVAEAAMRIARRPNVIARIAELLKAARAADLDSDGSVVADTIDACRASFEAGNMTAYVAALRLRSQQRAMLRDSLTVTAEGRLSDDELVEQLSRGDAARAATIRSLIGAKKFH